MGGAGRAPVGIAKLAPGLEWVVRLGAGDFRGWRLLIVGRACGIIDVGGLLGRAGQDPLAESDPLFVS